jgi:hypothetical protein
VLLGAFRFGVHSVRVLLPGSVDTSFDIPSVDWRFLLHPVHSLRGVTLRHVA